MVAKRPGRIKKPAPFRRPFIDLDRHGRAWRKVPASLVSAGDVIADFGMVESADTTISQNSSSVTFTSVTGAYMTVVSDTELFAFVRETDE